MKDLGLTKEEKAMLLYHGAAIDSIRARAESEIAKHAAAQVMAWRVISERLPGRPELRTIDFANVDRTTLEGPVFAKSIDSGGAEGVE
jgi:hypothetical protein